MPLINFTLNLAALLLWLNWRSVPVSVPASALTLASTLKPTDTRRGSGLAFWIGLPALLLGRALFYWQIGPAVDWTPHLPLGAITLSFRCDAFDRILLYSFLSFGLTLGIFYGWLCLLSAVNSRQTELDAVQRQVQLLIGPLAQFPAIVQALTPFVVAALLWLFWGPFFEHLRLMPPRQSFWQLMQQAVVIGFSLVLSLKYLVAGLLGLHFLNTYVYLGGAPFWNFVTVSARNLAWPLRWCRFGKVDLAPPVGIAVVLGLAELGNYWLPRLYQRLPF